MQHYNVMQTINQQESLNVFSITNQSSNYYTIPFMYPPKNKFQIIISINNIQHQFLPIIPYIYSYHLDYALNIDWQSFTIQCWIGLNITKIKSFGFRSLLISYKAYSYIYAQNLALYPIGCFDVLNPTYQVIKLKTDLNLTGYKTYAFISGYDLSIYSFYTTLSLDQLSIQNNILNITIKSLTSGGQCANVMAFAIIAIKSTFMQIGQYPLKLKINIYQFSALQNGIKHDTSIMGNSSFIGYYKFKIFNSTFSWNLDVVDGAIVYSSITPTIQQLAVRVIQVELSNNISPNHMCCNYFPIDIGNGLCSKLPSGCTDITYTSTTFKCTKCHPDFIYNPIDSTCNCPFGTYLATSHCISASGCLSAVPSPSGMVCTSCNKTQNFVLKNGICDCNEGFYLSNSSSVCQQVCGDGKLFDLECDDGNNKTGDGCSNECRIQRNYHCIGGSPTSPSICYVKIKDIKIIATTTTKIKGLNKGTFSFKVKSLPNVPLSPTLISSISLSSLIRSKLSSWKFTDNVLQAIVEYMQDLESQQITLKINLNPLFTDLPFVQLFLTVKSDDFMLLYQGQKSQTLGYVLWILIVIVGVSLIVAIVAGKMAAVQKLHSLTLIYILYLFAPNKTQTLSLIQYFSFFNFNIGFIKNQKANFKSKSWPVYSLDNIVEAQNILFAFQMLGVIVFLLYLASSVFQMKTRQKLVKATGLLYQHLVFPICFGLVYLGSLSYSGLFQGSCKSQIAKSMLAVAFSSLMTAKQMTCISRLQRDKSNEYLVVQQIYSQGKYVCLYCSWVVCQMFVILASSLGLIKWTLQIACGLSVLLLGAVLYFGPYNYNLDNLDLVVNYANLVFFVIWFMSRQDRSMAFQQQLQINVMTCLLLLLIISAVITIARSYCQIKRRSCQDDQENSIEVSSKRKQQSTVKTQQTKHLENKDINLIKSNNKVAKTQKQIGEEQNDPKAEIKLMQLLKIQKIKNNCKNIFHQRNIYAFLGHLAQDLVETHKNSYSYCLAFLLIKKAICRISNLKLSIKKRQFKQIQQWNQFQKSSQYNQIITFLTTQQDIFNRFYQKLTLKVFQQGTLSKFQDDLMISGKYTLEQTHNKIIQRVSRQYISKLLKQQKNINQNLSIQIIKLLDSFKLQTKFSQIDFDFAEYYLYFTETQQSTMNKTAILKAQQFIKSK